jgi:hypothetical protein
VQQKLVNFLAGTGADDHGRLLDELLAWNNHQLESCHDYIQWVFPNRSRSFFNPQAPVLNDETVQALKNNAAALGNLRRMLFRMYAFYDLPVTRFEDGSYQLEIDDSRPVPWWLAPNNHNFLRLTRILLTLDELDLIGDRDALFDMLDILSIRHRQLIGDKTIHYWRDAAKAGE